MSLIVRLAKTAGSETDYWDVLADQITHQFVRLPTQAGLPGDESTGAVSVLTIDVGIATETISVRGTVNNVSTTSHDPAKTDLETACRAWWNFGDDSTELPALTIDTGQTYRGHLKSMSFSRQGGLEDRWEFDLIFVVREKYVPEE